MLILVIFYNCTRASQEKTASTKANQNNITLAQTGTVHIQFVDKPLFNNMLNTKTKHNTGRLDYIAFYDDFEREGFPFNEVAKNSAAAYSTQSDWVMVRRYLSFFEFQDFLVRKGDSLIISFDPSKPIVLKNTTARYLPQDFNIETVINKKYPGAYLTAGMADDTRMVAFKHFFDDPTESEKQVARKGYEKGLYLENLENQMGRDLLISVKALRNNSQKLLDSLRNQRQISENVYSFYKQKYSNLLLKIEIMSGSIDSTQAAKELNSRFKSTDFKNEYYKQCLDNFEKKFITSRAKWTVSNQLNLRDPKESFKIASKSSLLNTLVKDQMLLVSLNKIDLYFPDETATYLKLFVNSVKDSSLIQAAREKFQRDKLINSIPSNLHLLTYNRKQTTIEELLKNKKGKVIYIDFWASWCVPCLEEMKYSKSLIKEYSNKEMEVVYLSLDDNYMKWSKASERLEINLAMNSFKILEPGNSQFFQDHKIKAIPRYMIVDKNGSIINTDAPRPSDLKIKKILDELVVN